MKKRLVVISPGLGQRVRHWTALIDRISIEKDWSDDTTDYLKHESSTLPLGLKRLAHLGQDLAARIHAQWVLTNGYEEVILIGHSMGGLVVRAAFLRDCGALGNQEGAKNWTKSVSRIVLLASPNRGVEKLPWYGLPFHWLVQRIPGPTLTYEDLTRGSAFVTNLRIAWIRHFLSEKAESPLPQVIQLLGDRDDVVHENDSIDVLAFPSGIYSRVPDATHGDIHRLDKLPQADSDRRYALLRAAIVEPEKLEVQSPNKDELAKPSPPRIIFILHGIRASRIDDWLMETENAIRDLFPSGTLIQRPNYGFFTAIRFTLPIVRRRNIRKFQDCYTETLARHPNVTPDFIGHSNGTYMLGQSLLEIPSMRFGNVLLAGSVLPENFPWDELLETQVQRVRSDRGQKDWPVGWLCSAMKNGMGMRDVGTGGYLGFERGQVIQERYHPGGHGDMFTKDNIPRMAKFTLGIDPGPELDCQLPALPWWSLVSRFMRWVPLLLLALCVFLFFLCDPLHVILGLLGLYLLLDLI